ncbi:hypothetical protein PFLmoz3_02834 [Pseudomonas fluorescens]|uniref:Uncharacterized protein n=1 Tax=Pseudomonas fluorescens TaxID=294 RepID=A0A120G7P0_PSEFL|nr:hypothetical protein PFLmoz3_02834 [Pseudomonas fluorescens]
MHRFVQIVPGKHAFEVSLCSRSPVFYRGAQCYKGLMRALDIVVVFCRRDLQVLGGVLIVRSPSNDPVHRCPIKQRFCFDGMKQHHLLRRLGLEDGALQHLVIGEGAAGALC